MVLCSSKLSSRPSPIDRYSINFSQVKSAPLRGFRMQQNAGLAALWPCLILSLTLLVPALLLGPQISVATASPAASASSSTNLSNQTSTLSGTKTSASVATTAEALEQTQLTKTSGKSSSELAKQQQQTAAEPQQSQSTDLSSMYVQIPIAEPADTGVPDGVQQTLTGETDSASGSDPKATTWTGPWPKKFQIGYIKQSDLHQVLIESLKNDPFVSMNGAAQTSGSKSSTATASTPSLPTTPQPIMGDNKLLSGNSDGGSQAVGHKTVQWPANTATVVGASYGGQQQQRQILRQPQMSLASLGNIYRPPPSSMTTRQNFRESKLVQQPFQIHAARFHSNQMGGFNSNQLRAFNSQHQQQHQKLLSMTRNNGNFPQQQQQQQHQYQLTEFPSNMFRNQPMYTINNYPQQDQQDSNTMMLMPAQQQFGQNLPVTLINNNHKPQKSSEYFSSWRPVTSDKSETGAQVKSGAIGGPTLQTEGQSLNDGFDDGFSSPSKESASNSNMNRHPVLNNYLEGGKISPAVLAKMRVQQSTADEAPIRGGASQTNKGSTKSGSPSSGSTKSSSGSGGVKGPDSGMSLSTNRRREQPADGGNSSSSSTTPNPLQTGATNDSNGTTVSSISTMQPTSQMATTTTPTQTTAPTQMPTTGASMTTTMQTDGETTEPDSEILESDTTDPNNLATTTTMASSAGANEAAGSTTAASVASGTRQQPDAGETEVATQAGGQQTSGTASLPGLTSDGDSSTAANSMREETTPSSSSPAPEDSSQMSSSSTTETSRSSTSAGGDTKGEVEGAASGGPTDATMSDEALLAAAVQTASDIGKTSQVASSAQQVGKAMSQTAMQRQRGSTSASAGAGSNKRTRSSERLLLQPAQSEGGKKSAPASPSSKLITKKPLVSPTSSRAAKQVSQTSQGAKGGPSSGKSTAASSAVRAPARSGNTKKRMAASGKPAKASSSPKSNRIVSAASNERTQSRQLQPQVVSMSAAQAQSTAQTLASLLLSRCLSSTNCAHLLDVCSTKQAMIPLNDQPLAASASPTTAMAANATQASVGWSMPIGLMSSSIMSLTQALQADLVLKTFPQWKDTIENIVDQNSQTGYTLILPSNEAMERLAAASIDAWLANPEVLAQIIDNHILDSVETIEFNSTSSRQANRTRVIRGKGLQVNQHRDRMVTINGKRLVYANQAAPSGGRIQVIDGILDWPTTSGQQSGQLLDIMDTLKQCDKFDGFVTLAEGTGLTQLLKQDGPMTVFVPSNEALRKIPDEELEVIKNNSTALKEFLMYHVVNGSYFSQDLRDGQQLPSILDMKPIQVGVRVDGCSRRLVEANTSPMRRPDIVAKNGVIHILDWYLTVRDNEWCDPIGRTTGAGDRLQQLASDQVATSAYATRVSMPANHKPAQVSATPTQHHLLAKESVSMGGRLEAALTSAAALAPHSPTSGNGLDTNNIIVSATPLTALDMYKAS